MRVPGVVNTPTWLALLMWLAFIANNSPELAGNSTFLCSMLYYKRKYQKKVYFIDFSIVTRFQGKFISIKFSNTSPVITWFQIANQIPSIAHP